MAQGRLPETGKKRDMFLHLRVDADEMKAVDAARGTQSRTTFVRNAVFDAAKIQRGAK